VTIGTTFRVRGEHGSRGTSPGTFWHHTHSPPTPSTVLLVVGVGRHPGEQCSAVKSSKSRGPVGGTMDRLRRRSRNEGSSFRWGSTAPCSADCQVSSSSLSSAHSPPFNQWTTFRVRGEPGSHGTNPGKFWHQTHSPPTPSTVLLVVGVGRHPAEQCSAVESSKSRGPVGDLILRSGSLLFSRPNHDSGSVVKHSQDNQGIRRGLVNNETA
jgi:hypothetical protein